MCMHEFVLYYILASQVLKAPKTKLVGNHLPSLTIRPQGNLCRHVSQRLLVQMPVAIRNLFSNVSTPKHDHEAKFEQNLPHWGPALHARMKAASVSTSAACELHHQ